MSKAVKIKDLEWIDKGALHYAFGIFNSRYALQQLGDGRWSIDAPKTESLGEANCAGCLYDTLPDAKRAAQSDYDERIFSAIDM